MKEPCYVKLVEYIRNDLVEQVHFGVILRMNKSGIINKIGEDNNYKFYHRSCMKPLQISPIIDLGIDKKYGLSEEEIAVCAASHSGDKIHQKHIKSILNKIGLTEDNLLCLAHEPLSRKEQEYLIKNSLPYTKIHNNCSGKHTAMLAICSELNFPISEYKNINHPLSDYIIEQVCRLCETKSSEIIISKDGCGLPVIATSLETLGRGFLNLFTESKYKKITNAFLNHPILIGGENRLDTQIIQNTKNIVAKVGACGLCVIVNLEKEEAIIIKIADSNMEARSFTAFSALKQLKRMDKSPISNEIKTLDNETTGFVNICFSL